MAGEYGPLETLTLAAAADLSGKLYHAVRLSAADACNQASDALNNGLIGILQNKPQSGEAAVVAYAGITKAVAGAAVTVGQVVTTNSSGRVIDATSGVMVIGKALQAAGADGQIISVLLQPAVRWGSL